MSVGGRNMEYQSVFEMKEYLRRFDQILCEMSNRMLLFSTTSNITINFIECMIPHHEAAISMSENLLTYTNYKPLYEMANNIIQVQTRGVQQMKQIVRTTQTRANFPNHVTSYENEYLRITKKMISKMKDSLRIQNINIDFAAEMIPHHEGAIEMCSNLLKYPVDQRLKLVAEDIIKEQTNGIKKLKCIQEELYK